MRRRSFIKAIAAAAAAVMIPLQITAFGSLLRIESLERSLHAVKIDDIKPWRPMVNVPAYNTVEEYNLVRGST